MFHYLNKNVRIFLLSDLLYYGGYDLLTAFFSILITTQIAEERLDILGMVISYQMIIHVIVEYPLSKMTNNLPFPAKKNIVAISTVMYGLAISLLGFSTTLWHVFAIISIIAIMEALSYPLKWSLFAKIQDRNREELEWSIEDVVTTLAAAIFSIIGGYLANMYGLPVVFIIFGCLFVGSGISFFFIHKK